MTCAEALKLAPLHLSGEMNGQERERFAAHLAACPPCCREMELQAQLDARLAEAVWRESPDAMPVEQIVRWHIAAARSRRRWIAAGAVAASAIAAVALSYAVPRFTPPSQLYADAAHDHWMEVVERQPRRWRAGAVEIEALAVRNELSFAQAAALAPAGYSLEHAKTCGLDGQRMLHLVFSNGVQEYSVYVRPERSAKEAVRVVRRSSERVASFETGQFRALVVTVGPAAECEELARFTAQRLYVR